jgi:hypothetical protein
MILIGRSKGHHLAFFDRPSQAQLDAGNYRKEKRDFQGMKVSIENPRGSIRSGVGPEGPWQTSMSHDYGYILGTLGVDGDHFDCYIGPNGAAPMVYLVTTKAPPDFTSDDEQKAMLGFNSLEQAREAYLAHYDDPRFLGSITEKTVEGFRREVMTTRKDSRMLKSLVLFRRLPTSR